MASIRREVAITASADVVWDALRDVGAIHRRLAPGFVIDVKLEDGETVIFAWITYESRAHRDEVNAKVMEDERMKALMDPAGEIADYQRMIYGGFELLVDERYDQSPGPTAGRPVEATA